MGKDNEFESCLTFLKDEMNELWFGIKIKNAKLVYFEK